MTEADRLFRERTRDRVLDGARLEPGDDVLDLGAAGTGLLAFGALARIGDGWVYAVRPEVAALEALLGAAHERGAPGIAYLVGDAEVLPLPDGSVDAAVTRSALADAADPAEAARELHRVLRPGGRLSCHQPVDRRGASIATAVDWSPLGEDLAARVLAEWDGHAAAAPPLRLDDRVLEAVLRDAGFGEVSVERVERTEEWEVDERSADARLDAIGAAGEPSLRERWTAAFGAEDASRLGAHLRSLAGTTLSFPRIEAWITAVRP